MGFVHSLVLAVHILVGLGVIVLVLLQHGKGADMGAAFGSGASGSLFGATGSANFLSRATGVLAAIFFATSLGLAYLANGHSASASGSVLDGANVAPVSVPASEVPATSAPDAGSKAGGVPK